LAPVSKREVRRQARRHMILTVATEYFLENGYSGTTMSEISNALGGSKGTLWNHFSSKEELFAAFLEAGTSAFRQEMMSTLVPSRALRPAVETFARRFIEKINMPESLSMYRLIVGESNRNPEIGRMFYERGPAAVRAILADFLENHMKAGRLRNADPTRAASTLVALCTGHSHQEILLGSPLRDRVTMANEARMITDEFLRIYAPEDKAP